MSLCQCGCKENSKGDFLPGHDQKLRARLESQVGGLLALRAMIDASQSYAEGVTDEKMFLNLVRATFANYWKAT